MGADSSRSCCASDGPSVVDVKLHGEIRKLFVALSYPDESGSLKVYISELVVLAQVDAMNKRNDDEMEGEKQTIATIDGINQETLRTQAENPEVIAHCQEIFGHEAGALNRKVDHEGWSQMMVNALRKHGEEEFKWIRELSELAIKQRKSLQACAKKLADLLDLLNSGYIERHKLFTLMEPVDKHTVHELCNDIRLKSKDPNKTYTVLESVKMISAFMQQFLQQRRDSLFQAMHGFLEHFESDTIDLRRELHLHCAEVIHKSSGAESRFISSPTGTVDQGETVPRSGSFVELPTEQLAASEEADEKSESLGRPTNTELFSCPELKEEEKQTISEADIAVLMTTVLAEQRVKGKTISKDQLMWSLTDPVIVWESLVVLIFESRLPDNIAQWDLDGDEFLGIDELLAGIEYSAGTLDHSGPTDFMMNLSQLLHEEWDKDPTEDNLDKATFEKILCKAAIGCREGRLTIHSLQLRCMMQNVLETNMRNFIMLYKRLVTRLHQVQVERLHAQDAEQKSQVMHHM